MSTALSSVAEVFANAVLAIAMPADGPCIIQKTGRAVYAVSPVDGDESGIGVAERAAATTTAAVAVDIPESLLDVLRRDGSAARFLQKAAEPFGPLRSEIYCRAHELLALGVGVRVGHVGDHILEHPQRHGSARGHSRIVDTFVAAKTVALAVDPSCGERVEQICRR